jgi:hypothetical protein
MTRDRDFIGMQRLRPISPEKCAHAEGAQHQRHRNGHQPVSASTALKPAELDQQFIAQTVATPEFGFGKPDIWSHFLRG